VADENVSDSFRFKSPYDMVPNRSYDNGFKWADGHNLLQIVHGRDRDGGRVRSPLSLR